MTIQQKAIDVFSKLGDQPLELGVYTVFQRDGSSGPIVVHQLTSTQDTDSGVFKHYPNVEKAIASIPKKELLKAGLV